MKTDLLDVNETRKNLNVEIPSAIVDAEIDRVARDYSCKARIPGFRPGKAPAKVIKQRFKEQILHDVAHDLVPRAIDEALRERGVEPVDTPDVRDVVVEEGKALTFTASFDTVPPFEVGDLSTLTLRRPSTRIADDAVAQALERLRDRAARFEAIEGRGVVEGDTITADLARKDGTGQTDTHTDVSVELGASANPPGFDAQLLNMSVGDTKSFDVHYPADHPIGELANTSVSYTVTVKGLKRRVLPALDDEFAKDLGEFETLEALTSRVRHDLEHEAGHAAERAVRGDLMKQLASRVTFTVPESLVEREGERRLEEFAGRLMEQGIDPRTANLDWRAFRDSQREPAREAVAGALVLDEIARRERIEVTTADVDREIERWAERSGRTPAAMRAAFEKEGGLSRLYTGLRREKAIDLAMSRATIAQD
jgi:trigger factor